MGRGGRGRGAAAKANANGKGKADAGWQDPWQHVPSDFDAGSVLAASVLGSDDAQHPGKGSAWQPDGKGSAWQQDGKGSAWQEPDGKGSAWDAWLPGKGAGKDSRNYATDRTSRSWRARMPGSSATTSGRLAFGSWRRRCRRFGEDQPWFGSSQAEPRTCASTSSRRTCTWPLAWPSCWTF